MIQDADIVDIAIQKNCLWLADCLMEVGLSWSTASLNCLFDQLNNCADTTMVEKNELYNFLIKSHFSGQNFLKVPEAFSALLSEEKNVELLKIFVQDILTLFALHKQVEDNYSDRIEEFARKHRVKGFILFLCKKRCPQIIHAKKEECLSPMEIEDIEIIYAAAEKNNRLFYDQLIQHSYIKNYIMFLPRVFRLQGELQLPFSISVDFVKNTLLSQNVNVYGERVYSELFRYIDAKDHNELFDILLLLQRGLTDQNRWAIRDRTEILVGKLMREGCSLERLWNFAKEQDFADWLWMIRECRVNSPYEDAVRQFLLDAPRNGLGDCNNLQWDALNQKILRWLWSDLPCPGIGNRTEYNLANSFIKGYFEKYKRLDNMGIEMSVYVRQVDGYLKYLSDSRTNLKVFLYLCNVMMEQDPYWISDRLRLLDNFFLGNSTWEMYSRLAIHLFMQKELGALVYSNAQVIEFYDGSCAISKSDDILSTIKHKIFDKLCKWDWQLAVKERDQQLIGDFLCDFFNSEVAISMSDILSGKSTGSQRKSLDDLPSSLSDILQRRVGFSQGQRKHAIRWIGNMRLLIFTFCKKELGARFFSELALIDSCRLFQFSVKLYNDALDTCQTFFAPHDPHIVQPIDYLLTKASLDDTHLWKGLSSPVPEIPHNVKFSTIVDECRKLYNAAEENKYLDKLTDDGNGLIQSVIPKKRREAIDRVLDAFKNTNSYGFSKDDWAQLRRLFYAFVQHLQTLKEVDRVGFLGRFICMGLHCNVRFWGEMHALYHQIPDTTQDASSFSFDQQIYQELHALRSELGQGIVNDYCAGKSDTVHANDSAWVSLSNRAGISLAQQMARGFQNEAPTDVASGNQRDNKEVVKFFELYSPIEIFLHVNKYIHKKSEIRELALDWFCDQSESIQEINQVVSGLNRAISQVIPAFCQKLQQDYQLVFSKTCTTLEAIVSELQSHCKQKQKATKATLCQIMLKAFGLDPPEPFHDVDVDRVLALYEKVEISKEEYAKLQLCLNDSKVDIGKFSSLSEFVTRIRELSARDWIVTWMGCLADLLPQQEVLSECPFDASTPAVKSLGRYVMRKKWQYAMDHELAGKFTLNALLFLLHKLNVFQPPQDESGKMVGQLYEPLRSASEPAASH